MKRKTFENLDLDWLIENGDIKEIIQNEDGTTKIVFNVKVKERKFHGTINTIEDENEKKDV